MCRLLVISNILILLVGITIASAANAEWERAEYTTMGTNILVEVYHQDAQTRKQGIEAVIAEMERINSLMSTYIPNSKLSILNKDAYKQDVMVSQEIFDLLTISRQVSRLTKGAFDITYESVGYLYSFPEQVIPTEEQITKKLKAVNYELVKLNADKLSIRFLHPDVKINLGGIAKGYAVDQSIEILVNLGFEHALVTAGGDTRLLGDRLGKPWIVGIRDPRNKDKQAVLLPLNNTAMSTSGDYERYFEEGGVRHHHIISPTTGKSSYGVQSVSIIGPESVYNDALSTAVFVLGLQEGLGLINALDSFEAIVMDENRKLHYSNGLTQ